MSYKEKSAWISLISTLGLFTYYFYHILQLSDLPEALAKSAAFDLSIRVIVFAVIVQVIFQGLLAASNHRDANLADDEREQLFNLKSIKHAHNILLTGAFICIGRLVLIDYNPDFADQHSSLQIPMLTAHILLFSFILSEVVRFISLIIYYRKG